MSETRPARPENSPVEDVSPAAAREANRFAADWDGGPEKGSPVPGGPEPVRVILPPPTRPGAHGDSRSASAHRTPRPRCRRHRGKEPHPPAPTVLREGPGVLVV